MNIGDFIKVLSVIMNSKQTRSKMPTLIIIENFQDSDCDSDNGLEILFESAKETGNLPLNAEGD